VLKVLPFLVLMGCVSSHSHQPSDTFFNESERDWSAVYRTELDIAAENSDKEAWYFFMQELVKLRMIEQGLTPPAAPMLRFKKLKD